MWERTAQNGRWIDPDLRDALGNIGVKMRRRVFIRIRRRQSRRSASDAQPSSRTSIMTKPIMEIAQNSVRTTETPAA